MTHPIDPAEFVLGLLEGEQADRARRLEREDPAFAAEVRALRGAGARLSALQADEWAAAGPPPLNVAAVVAAPQGPEPALSRGPSALDRLRSRLGGGRGLVLRPAFAGALAAVFVALGIGVGLLVSGGSGDDAPQGAVIALQRFGVGPAGASATATVARQDGVREVTIDTRGLAPSAPGQTYEVWMIHDATRMVSLGTFRVGPGGRAIVTLPVTADPAAYPIMDISEEPLGGPASHSGRSVLRSA